MIDTSQCWLKDNCNQVDCNKEYCIKLLKLDYLYNEANISLNQRENVKLSISSVNKEDENAFNYLSKFCENILDNISNGKNIYIYSDNVGNGKTVWSIKILQAYFNKIWPTSKLECRALFIHVPQFLLALKDNISEKSEYIQHVKENILNCDLVIFDELGTKTATQFELEHLLSYINTRLSFGKSCIYTSNIQPDSLANLLGDRLASRVINLSECVELKGPDMRKLTLKKGE